MRREPRRLRWARVLILGALTLFTVVPLYVIRASGPAMVRWALDQGWASDIPDGAALAAAAKAGHPMAVAAFERGARALAAGIVSAVALCEVDRVVIGAAWAAPAAIPRFLPAGLRALRPGRQDHSRSTRPWWRTPSRRRCRSWTGRGAAPPRSA